MVEEKEINKINDNNKRKKANKERINITGQHDSGEFFIQTLNIIKDAEKSISINDNIFKHLDIKIVTKKKCMKCYKASISQSEQSTGLQLPISDLTKKSLKNILTSIL